MSPVFRQKFLTLVRNELTDSKKQSAFSTDLSKLTASVHTQYAFADDAAGGDGDDADDGGRRGYFDLVIAIGTLALIIEVKFYSGFGEHQIPTYRKEIDAGETFSAFSEKYLVSLTRQSVPNELVPLLDAKIFWPQVLETLNTAAAETESEDNGMATPAKFMLTQFAEFLKTKRVTPMKIEKFRLEDLKAWSGLYNFKVASSDILERFREEQNVLWRPKRVGEGTTTVGTDTFNWWGVYSNKASDDWCGFVFYYAKDPPDLRIQVEGKFPKGTGIKQARQFFGETLKNAVDHKFFRVDRTIEASWLVFWQPILPDFNGKGDAIYEWLASAAKEFSELRKQFP